MSVAYKTTLYQDLESLPERLIGEIIDGTLYAHPKGSAVHQMAITSISSALLNDYQRGKGDDGWWIIAKPEAHFERDTQVAVPDIAGWRKQTMPELPPDHRFLVRPDWLCEVLSPSTESHDRTVKMALYASHGVPHYWIVHPHDCYIEAYELSSDGQYQQFAIGHEKALFNSAPFNEFQMSVMELLKGL